MDVDIDYIDIMERAKLLAAHDAKHTYNKDGALLFDASRLTDDEAQLMQTKIKEGATTIVSAVGHDAIYIDEDYPDADIHIEQRQAVDKRRLGSSTALSDRVCVYLAYVVLYEWSRLLTNPKNLEFYGNKISSVLAEIIDVSRYKKEPDE